MTNLEQVQVSFESISKAEASFAEIDRCELVVCLCTRSSEIQHSLNFYWPRRPDSLELVIIILGNAIVSDNIDFVCISKWDLIARLLQNHVADLRHNVLEEGYGVARLGDSCR